jgi:hypothetical protein
VDRQLAVHGEQLFALVARHPMLTRQQLATLLNTSAARISHLMEQLLKQGWVRAITPDDVPDSAVGSRLHQLRRLALVELTLAGRRESARRLLVPAALTARHHGLGGRAATRRRLLRHLAHTLGANAFFVALACAARRVTQRGGDDALDEWRSAAACARGRFRPDGYGCYRRGPSRFGFFLEYDRGTERPVEYAAKLAAYYRYRDSGDSTREYNGFPTLLVVTTTEVAETRFAQQAYLAGQCNATAPMLVFLTTTRRIEAHADGVLGPIWCTPGPSPWPNRRARVFWLPAQSSRGLGRERAASQPHRESTKPTRAGNDRWAQPLLRGARTTRPMTEMGTDHNQRMPTGASGNELTLQR